MAAALGGCGDDGSSHPDAGNDASQNVAPEPLTAEPDEAITARAVAVELNVVANDQRGHEGGAWVQSFTEAQHGSVHQRAGGQLVYTPPAGFDGVDVFAYTLRDGLGRQSQAQVTVTVLPRPGTVSGGVLYAVTETVNTDHPRGMSWSGLNNVGQKFGTREPNAVIQNADGTFLSVVGDNEGDDVNLHGMNDAGQVVGFIFGADDLLHGFLWSEGAFVETFSEFTPNGINNAGVIVGANWDDGARAFIRDPDGTVTEFTLPDAEQVALQSINNRGDLLGIAKFSDGAHTRFQCFIRYQDGTVTRLAIPAWYEGWGFTCSQINDDGHVVGYAAPPDSWYESSFIWTPERGFTPLHFPQPPVHGSYARGEIARGINKEGVIAGYYFERVPYVDPQDNTRKFRLTFHALEFTPITPKPNTRYEDSSYGYVK